MIGRSPPLALAVPIAIGLTLVVLSGCGGGDEPLDPHTVSTQPVDCGGGNVCK